MKNTHQIRFAKPEDLPELVNLCALHAQYEQADYDPLHKEKALRQHIFSEPPALYCLVVELENQLIGYTTYMKQYSTWDASFYVYMDCLFLTSESRGMGIGQQLMNRIAKETEILGCSLIQWQTPDFNKRAIKFYHRIGAESKRKERFFLNVTV